MTVTKLFIRTGFPATAASNGKALLALQQKRRLVETPAAYRADLTATRTRGYAMDFEEFQEGVNGVSAPIFSPNGHAIATLPLVAPVFRMTEANLRKYGRKCVEFAAQLSIRLRQRGNPETAKE